MEAELISGISDPNDGGQYIEDASLFRDILPQPYRMIDKLLCKLVDEAWNLISCRQVASQCEAERYKPPFLLHRNQIRMSSDCNCLTLSPDEKLLIIGLCDGVTVIDIESHNLLCSWSNADVSVVHLSVTCLPECCYLLTTVDSKGIPRLFCVTQIAVFLMATFDRTIIHQLPDSSEPSCQSTVCTPSHLSEFLAVNFGDDQLDIYELPRDTWMKEIDTALKQKQSSEVTQTSSVEAPTDQVKEFTFSKPALLMKILPPNDVKSSPSLTAVKGLGSSGRVCVGSTMSTVMSQRYLSTRKHEFEEKYLPVCVPKSALAATTSKPGSPNFHFIISSERDSCSSDNAKLKGANLDTGKSLIVWWNNRNFIQRYLLMKSTSKTSEVKSEFDWPISCSVTASAVSPCSFLVSFALTNCNVILWNRKTGERSIVLVEGAVEIEQLEYLSKCCCTGSCYCQLPRCGHSTYLLARCSSGKVYQLYMDSSRTAVTEISPEIIDNSEIPIYLRLLKTHTSISLMRQKNGRVHVYDMSLRRSVGEALLPLDYSQFLPDRMDSTTVTVTNKDHKIFALGKNNGFYRYQQSDICDEMFGDDIADPGKEGKAGGAVEQSAGTQPPTEQSAGDASVNLRKSDESLKRKQIRDSQLVNEKEEEEEEKTTTEMSREGEGYCRMTGDSSDDCSREAAQPAVDNDVMAMMSSLRDRPSDPCSVFVYSIEEILGDECVHSAPEESDRVRSESSLEDIVERALKHRICGQEERKLRLHNLWFTLTENFAT